MRLITGKYGMSTGVCHVVMHELYNKRFMQGVSLILLAVVSHAEFIHVISIA